MGGFECHGTNMFDVWRVANQEIVLLSPNASDLGHLDMPALLYFYTRNPCNLDALSSHEAVVGYELKLRRALWNVLEKESTNTRIPCSHSSFSPFNLPSKSRSRCLFQMFLVYATE